MKFRISLVLDIENGVPCEAYKLSVIYDKEARFVLESEENIGTFPSEQAARTAALIFRKAEESEDIEFDIL